MLRNDLDTLLHCLGKKLFRDRLQVTIELYGSAVLVLAYPCLKRANDIDARWDLYDDMLLRPYISEIANKTNHPQGEHWLNNDVGDIVAEEGEWAKTVRYGGLYVKIPSQSYMMSLLVRALYKCTSEPGHGKDAQKFLAFQKYLQWDKDTILNKSSRFVGPRGYSGPCLEWLERLMNEPSLKSNVNMHDTSVACSVDI